MEYSNCWHCGDALKLTNNGAYIGEYGKAWCPGSPNEEHRPATSSDYIDSIKNNLKRNKEERKKLQGSSASYCAGCHSKFPSSQGYPHTQSGETLIYCPVCKDNGKVFDEVDGFSVSARVKKSDAPALDLECDTCGDEVDAGDDNDADPMGGPGDPCMNCSHGKLKFAKSKGMTIQDEFEDSSLLQADDQSAMTPDVAQGIYDADSAPRSFKPPRSMMREQVNGLDKMNNGGGMSSMSHKTASYESMRNHLIQHHNFKNDWLQGYNEKDLMRVFDQAHKHGAYACDHEHPISDYQHNTMVTSHKIAGDIIRPPDSFWTGESPDNDDYPKSMTLINPKDRNSWEPMNPYRDSKYSFTGFEHTPGQFDKDTWHYNPGNTGSQQHGSYTKFYGTMKHDADTNVGLDAVVKLTATNDVSGGNCKECGSSHGWKWQMHSPTLGMIAGTKLKPLYTYDENGKKKKVQGYASTRPEAVLEADLSHHKEFVQPINESQIDY